MEYFSAGEITVYAAADSGTKRGREGKKVAWFPGPHVNGVPRCVRLTSAGPHDSVTRVAVHEGVCLWGRSFSAWCAGVAETRPHVSMRDGGWAVRRREWNGLNLELWAELGFHVLFFLFFFLSFFQFLISNLNSTYVMSFTFELNVQIQPSVRRIYIYLFVFGIFSLFSSLCHFSFIFIEIRYWIPSLDINLFMSLGFTIFIKCTTK
jgi:hypothetical protein